MHKIINLKWFKFSVGVILSIVSLCMFVTCSEDDSFTQDTNALLTFESDTITFDTIFATVPSSTRRIRIFNRADKGVRIQSVSLASGGRSGFRINVDGFSGPDISAVEVAGRDSLFFFADVTPAVQTTDQPTEVCDTVRFRLENGIVQSLILKAAVQNVDFIEENLLLHDFVIEKGRPCIIRDSLVVGEEATLTINPGAILCFHDGAWLGVKGKLHVKGTVDSPVVFRGDRTDRMFSYLPYDRLDGQWGGISLLEGCKESLIDHADIHGGAWGIRATDVGGENTVLTLTNSSVHNVRGCALQLTNINAVIANSQMSNAGEDCVQLEGGNYTFTHCTIAQFYPWSSYGYALSLSAGIADDYKPLQAANFYNCIITGRTGDQINLSPPVNQDIPFVASFVGSLVNIELPNNTPEQYRIMFEGAVNEYDKFAHASTQPDDTKNSFGGGNFKSIDDDVYYYDFHIDSLSSARGIGNAEKVGPYKVDKDGISRNSANPDAGCYQFK